MALKAPRLVMSSTADINACAENHARKDADEKARH